MEPQQNTTNVPNQNEEPQTEQVTQPIQEQTNQTQYDYVGKQVQIGGGFGGMKPLAQQGTVIINQGEISLYDSKDQLIHSAPLSQTAVKSLWYTLGGTAMLTMGGKKYSVSINHGQFAVGPFVPPSVTLGATSVSTADFVKIFKALKATQPSV